ncbi:MAG: type I-F CRISPR-associated protein Csy1 [Giesbergeria sp.]|jgi:CRISPR-associated protein Csy1|nr:type I-F CRISPR-associated protein Csy1 [Giesbergeria sp.]
MSDDYPPDRRTAFRALIERFLREVRDGKLDKLSPDSPEYINIVARYEPATWLENAAKRVADIQAVTHPAKATYPDAKIREITSLFVDQATLAPHPLAGSHCVDTARMDVTGNAASLDVYKFLCVDLFGQTLIDWLRQGDPDLIAALSDDPEQAAAWSAAFVGLVGPRCAPASHSRNKQVYWLTGEDPLEDGDYHLLGPLHASTLAHEVFLRINEDRFGEAATAARQARREQKDHPHGFAEYRGLAAQKLGGTKPQNISQLNSERGGVNYLLASLPPHWQSREGLNLKGVDSVFGLFGRQHEVRSTVAALKAFLQDDPPATMETRERVDSFLAALIDELVIFAEGIRRGQSPGWTTLPGYVLEWNEQLWLDPLRCHEDEAFGQAWHYMDWPAEIGQRFGNWLNGRLDGHLPVGEIEARHWQTELLVDEGEGSWAQALHGLRQQNEAPTFVPTREGQS